ncbi:MAG: phosphotransferase [Chloroflexales bacterium]|nr:phosphotransferase [Chloroflexales bacterium]
MITATQIAFLLEVHGLGPLRAWRMLDSGEGTESYLLNEALVLQLGGSEPAGERLRKEAAIYTLLRDTALPVPRVLALDASRAALPSEMLLLERVQGRPALDLWPTLSNDAQQRLSHDLGRLLAQLHGVACAGYGGYYGAVDRLGGSEHWRSYLLDKVAGIMLDLWQHEGLPAPLLYGAEGYLMRVPIPERPPAALVHGDFGLHNVLLARAGGAWRVSGITGFRWALAADPEYEFATGLLVEADEVNPLPEPFLRGYRSLRSLDEGWRLRTAAYRLVYHLALCADVCRMYNGDQDMLRYHRGMIVDILKAWV